MKRFLCGVLFIVLSHAGFGQVMWTNPITGTSPGLTSPYTAGQTVAANLTVSGISRGIGLAANAGNDRYNAANWSTGGFNASDYFQFVLTPAAGYELNFVSFQYIGQRSPTGPREFELRSSLDGYTSAIGTATATGTTISLNGAQYQNLAGSIIFRFYGYFADADSGTFSINDFTFNGTVSRPTVDWANLQFPGTATINLGDNATFYARCYEPGVTPGAGQGSNITAWIGYSTADTNPSSAGWTWIPATYNTDAGNDDEYSATFGAALPEGTYYVASRFRLGSGTYTYGGFSTGGGNFWDGTTYRSALLTINGPTTLDWGNLQSPPNGNLVLGNVFDVYAQVYEPGVTDTAGSQGGGITVWIGYSSANTNPASAGWTWTEATFNPFGGGNDNDEYMLDIGTVIPAAGTYYYASRFQLDDGAYRYGGIQASGVNGNFWDGTEFISGVLTVTLPPMQEIKVNGNTGGGTGPITDGSTTTTGLNSTSFGTTPIGTPIVKSFRIENEGTANLTLSGAPIVTIGGANPADFTVTVQPSSTNLAPSASTTFSISFNPTAVGPRSATVSFANNDTDENPFNFAISGNGQCGATANTVTPLSGPEGTEVTITATSNNLNGATVTFNGVAASVTQISPTQIKAIVPAGATTGTMMTTNAEGCSASTYFTVVDFNVASCEGNTGTARSTLFISEVTDHGTGSHSYVEIFNATGAAVSLGGWSIRTHNNGASTPTGTINLNNVVLPNNTAYVVAFGGTDHNANWGGVSPNQTQNISGINEDDHIRLYQGSTWIDLWGDTSGNTFTIAPKDYVYRRKNIGITAPSTTWDANDWEAFTPVNYTNVGQYSFSVGALPFVSVHPSYSPTCKATTLSVTATEGFVGGNPLAYQWYVAAPGSTTWTAVTNTGVYSGATTANLNISNVSGLNDYQYYVQVRENTATCYTASNAVKITAITKTWNGSVWSPSAPTITDMAIINGNYNTAAHGSFEACSVTVNGGFNLTISDNNYVSIQYDLTVNNTATLQVLNQGSLVMIDDSGIVTNNGTTHIQKTTSPYNKFDYTYWSSPVAATTIGTALAGWRHDYSFQFATSNYADILAPVDGFDDDNNAWQFAGAGAAMTPGKGYAVMAPTTGSFPATSTVTFSGKANNGIITVPMALSGNPANTNDDFNLIGNPYPSAISADDFINTNTNMSGTLYFWTHRTGISQSNPGPDANNFITDDYAMYNLSGGTSSGTGSPVPNGFVASGQGFFVEAVTATNIQFNNSMRSRLHPNNQFFRVAQEEAGVLEKDRIWLNMESSDGLFSQLLIGYFENASMDFDRGYDGIVNQTTNSISFYSFIGEDKYRIQGRPSFDQEDRVPLGFSANIAGSYQIKIGNREGQLNTDDRKILLEDKLLGITHDLTSSEYMFTTETGTFNERFLLKYIDGALGTNDSSAHANVIAFAANDAVHIKSTGRIDSIEIFDIAGRQIYSVDNLGDHTYSVTGLSIARQALIVRIRLEDGSMAVRKIVF